MLQELLFGHIISTLDAFGEADAQREMAASVLIIERIVEQNATFADRRVLGDERDLAQTSGTFVGVNDARKRRLAHAGIVVHYAAGLELNPKIVNLVTVVNERHSRIHDTVDAHTIRRGEDFLGGNVGEEGVPIGRLALAAGPLVTFRHANRQIGSICRGVMQIVETIVVQETQVLFERRVMKLPVALRVLAIGTSGVQNRIP